MPKSKSSGKGFIRAGVPPLPKGKGRKSKSHKRKNMRRQRGGRVTMAGAYYNPNHTAHYHTAQELVAKGGVNPMAVSHGNPNGTTDTVGGNLNPYGPYGAVVTSNHGNMTGGGVLPAEYFGGNSGRYFEAGSPELSNCTNAYGVAFPSSHGVVMPGDNANFMGPQLAASPNWLDMTGGSRRRRYKKRGKKSKKRNLKKKSKSKNARRSKKR